MAPFPSRCPMRRCSADVRVNRDLAEAAFVRVAEMQLRLRVTDVYASSRNARARDAESAHDALRRERARLRPLQARREYGGRGGTGSAPAALPGGGMGSLPPS